MIPLSVLQMMEWVLQPASVCADEQKLVRALIGGTELRSWRGNPLKWACDSRSAFTSASGSFFSHAGDQKIGCKITYKQTDAYTEWYKTVRSKHGGEWGV